jgi:hypothetical protein
LSDPQDDISKGEHAFEVVRARDEEMRGEDFLDDRADARQRE